jgi:hypothetical protein
MQRNAHGKPGHPVGERQLNERRPRMNGNGSAMQMRGLIQVLLYVLGYGLLISGVAGTGYALYSTLPYWTGESCSMALLGIYALPFTVPPVIVGAFVVWAGRRYGARPPDAKSK